MRLLANILAVLCAAGVDARPVLNKTLLLGDAKEQLSPTRTLSSWGFALRQTLDNNNRTTTDTNTTDTTTTDKISYTPEQQKHLDTVVIPSRLKRERAVLTRELSETLTGEITAKVTSELRAQYEADVETLHAELAAAKKGNGSNAEKVELQRALAEANARAAALQEQAKLAGEHASRRDAEIYKRDKRDAMVKAMGGRFVNENAVLVITDGAVQLDTTTGEYVVLDEKGNIRVGASMEPISLETYFGEIAEQHSYLAAGKIKGGAGASSSSTNGAQTRQVLAKSDLKDDAAKIKWINENATRNSPVSR